MTNIASDIHGPDIRPWTSRGLNEGKLEQEPPAGCVTPEWKELGLHAIPWQQSPNLSESQVLVETDLNLLMCLSMNVYQSH